MYQNKGVKEGMTVRSMDGHKLGKVYAVSAQEFFIEKGIFFPRDYSVRFGEVSDILDGEIILAHGKDSLRSFSDAMLYNSNLPLQDDSSPRTEASLQEDEAVPNTPEASALAQKRPYEGLHTQDLGTEGVGPYNTEGASASPILTEEDRAASRRSSTKPVLPPPLGRPMEPRPAMNASDEGAFVNRNLEDDLDEERRMEQRRDELEGENRRRLELGGTEDDLTRRGY
jgi:hypothetical protein